MQRDMNLYRHRLNDLRNWLEREGLDGILLPVTDEYQGEYSAAYARRVTWLNGFDGSAGMVVVLRDKAALLVDGRYTLQASQEADARDWEVRNSAEHTAGAYLREHVRDGALIGYDPWLHTAQQIERIGREVAGHAVLIAQEQNPVDALWEDQPARPRGPLTPQPLEFAGVSHTQKLAELHQAMRTQGADAFVITLPENLCWMLNMRGEDVPFNPLPLAYGLAQAEGPLLLFVEPSQMPDELRYVWGEAVVAVPPSQMEERLAALAGVKVGYDAERSAIWWRQALERAGAQVVTMSDPVTPAKAVKNEAEIAGIKRAHRIDGAAVARLLCWFDALDAFERVDELQVVRQLERCRQVSEHYRVPSFATIAGSGPHGAIVHYRADEASNRAIEPGEVLLLDSGGQYPFGTTDITRTVVRGEASQTFREHFTLVLKGHIALAQAQFPTGTSGGQLDALARLPLWQFGLDYDHGTGHGVGAYLCVHEGPQRIAKRSGDVPLQPGMILSNEPGYYQTDAYGIRIENLVLVVEKEQSGGRRFLGFETLTLCSIDTRLIEKKLLSDAERAWLNTYHDRVLAALSPQLDEFENRWLAERCRAI